MPDGMKEVVILLVEDDQGHAVLIEKNLRRANIANPLVHLTDGQQALDYLLGSEEKPGADPGSSLLMVLDLNLPRVNGFTVLERMKADERTGSIPVVVLTTTDDPREIARCYELGCNVYVGKPVEYEKFAEAIRRLGLFFSVVSIPVQARAGDRREE